MLSKNADSGTQYILISIGDNYLRYGCLGREKATLW